LKNEISGNFGTGVPRATYRKPDFSGIFENRILPGCPTST
jgi:hypothetical protein